MSTMPQILPSISGSDSHPQQLRWLMRRCAQSAAIGDGSSTSFAPSELGFHEPRRSVVTSCRAILLPQFGGAEVLELRENVGVPDLKPHEVLVRVRARLGQSSQLQDAQKGAIRSTKPAKNDQFSSKFNE